MKRLLALASLLLVLPACTLMQDGTVVDCQSTVQATNPDDQQPQQDQTMEGVPDQRPIAPSNPYLYEISDAQTQPSDQVATLPKANP